MERWKQEEGNWFLLNFVVRSILRTEHVVFRWRWYKQWEVDNRGKILKRVDYLGSRESLWKSSTEVKYRKRYLVALEGGGRLQVEKRKPTRSWLEEVDEARKVAGLPPFSQSQGKSGSSMMELEDMHIKGGDGVIEMKGTESCASPVKDSYNESMWNRVYQGYEGDQNNNNALSLGQNISIDECRSTGSHAEVLGQVLVDKLVEQVVDNDRLGSGVREVGFASVDYASSCSS